MRLLQMVKYMKESLFNKVMQYKFRFILNVVVTSKLDAENGEPADVEEAESAAKRCEYGAESVWPLSQRALAIPRHLIRTATIQPFTTIVQNS